MWLFSKFHLLQLLVSDVYYAKTNNTSANLEKKCELMLMTCKSTTSVFDRRTKVAPVLPEITRIH
jgi:hypothetical protein